MNEIQRRRRLLIIDDNRSIHEDFRKILIPLCNESLEAAEDALFGAPVSAPQQPAFEIDSAYQGAEGLKLATQALREGRPYALAFVDVRMPPGWDGVETTERLWEACPDLEIVLCTAYSDYSWEEFKARLGGSDQLVILKKPFDAIEVLQLANALTGKWRLRHAARMKMGDLEFLVRERTQVLEETNARLHSEVLERQRVVAALGESEERYQLLFQTNPLPMWVSDGESLGILAVNETAIREYGYSAPEFLAMTVRELLLPDGIQSPPESQARTCEEAQRVVTRHRKKDGTVIDVEILSRAIVFGGRAARLSLAHDITEQIKMEALLLRAQRMEGIGTLATGMAHDLNNILAPILMSAGALRWDLKGAERELAISRIELSVKRGSEIIQQVLTFGRGISGERVPVGAAQVLEEVARIIEQTFPKNIVLALEIPPQLSKIMGDRTQVHQVLLNLCINARDAMAQGGRLTLRARDVELGPSAEGGPPAGSYVTLEVADTGCGIAPANRERIFDPFFTTKEVGKGSGLGLATALGIVKSHGGFISVESELGRGTTFRLLLPATVDAVVADASPGGAKRLLWGSGESILVVDDEESILGAMRGLLERHGYKTMAARDGREALARIQEDGPPVAAVVTDMMMPGMDGLELIRALRERDSGLKIIASSGLQTPGRGSAQAGELEALGVTCFLPKPYTAEKLLTALRGVLDGKSGFDLLNSGLTPA